MNDQRSDHDPAAPGPDITDGRYLYCVVELEEPVHETSVDIDGVDDEPVSIVSIGEDATSDRDGDRSAIGAVVHACDELYDAADPRIVRKWLVHHQRVVDEATSQFGTPVPFQFDTILSGGDEGLRSWLRDERDALSHALEALVGTQEYRIDVVRTEPIPAAAIVDEDDELATLETEIESASEGRAHLMQRQFDQQLTRRRRERDDELATTLRERIEPVVSRFDVLDRQPTVSLDDSAADTTPDDRSEDDEVSGSAAAESADGEPVCGFAVLATDEEIDEVGQLLDSVADRDGIAVRFTGPWPPYSFVPTFGSDGEA